MSDEKGEIGFHMGWPSAAMRIAMIGAAVYLLLNQHACFAVFLTVLACS